MLTVCYGHHHSMLMVCYSRPLLTACHLECRVQQRVLQLPLWPPADAAVVLLTHGRLLLLAHVVQDRDGPRIKRLLADRLCGGSRQHKAVCVCGGGGGGIRPGSSSGGGWMMQAGSSSRQRLQERSRCSACRSEAAAVLSGCSFHSSIYRTCQPFCL